MIRTDSRKGRFALMVAHCAGMVDLVALPVWVGTLISRYGFDPQQAGLLATLFLLGAVLASLALAPQFQRLSGRTVAAVGFGVAALAFLGLTQTTDFATMALLHALAGLAAGAGLSMTHGTIACSAHPHRLFAVVGIALGVFGIAFMGATPPLIAAHGGPLMFQVFGALMGLAAVVAALAFPTADRSQRAATETSAVASRMPRAVWFGIVGVSGMALVQAMMFSFLERVGVDRGFSVQAITAVLVALGVVNMFPAGLAALLEKRWPAYAVLRAGPIVQALLVVVMVNTQAFAAYAGAASVFAAVMIFTHTFAFGLIAQLDRSGRALAATPAMLMVGAAIGPILGGTLIKYLGYGSLSVAAIVVALVALMCFARLPRQGALPAQTATTPKVVSP